MNDFHRGLLIGALGGLVLGSIAAYVLYGWWVTKLLRGIAEDTRRLLDRAPPPQAEQPK